MPGWTKRERRHIEVKGAGTGVFTAVTDPQAGPTRIRVISYGPETFTEADIEDPAKLRDLVGRAPVTWVDVTGLADIEALLQIGEALGLHRVALEDVADVTQRAKFESFGDKLFFVAQAPDRPLGLEPDQLSIFLGRGMVVTFQGRPGDCFDPLRDRLRRQGSRLRLRGPDYLVYSMLDAVIESYFPLVEQYGDRLQEAEDRILGGPDPQATADLHAMKRELMSVRRMVWPLREALSSLTRDKSDLIEADTSLYLRGCYDRTYQLMELVETHRETCSDLMALYMSNLSNRLNEVMKVLTVISTIFIPLTFIAGLYGMNFDTGASPWNMPELKWRWGYPVCLGLMFLVALGLLAVFWRKGWLGRDGQRRGPSEKKGGQPSVPE